MKVTVIGAGTIGAAVAYHLSRQPEIEHLQVCDAGARSLQYLHQRIRDPRLRSFQIDARDPNVLEPILSGSDCVVNCIPLTVMPSLAELCLQHGSHYCDLGGNEAVVARELALAEEAQRRNLWVVPNCGLSPGLCNILCMHGVEQFDEVQAVHIRVGNIPLRPEPPFNFRISWSADKILDDYTIPAQIISDGEVREVPALSDNERIDFADPFGTMEAFHTSGGLTTLVNDLSGRVQTLDYKTVRWPGHADQMRFLLGLGFAEKQTIDVRTHLSYRDVLIRRMRQRLGGEYQDAVLLRIAIQGRKEGRDQTLLYELFDQYDEEQKLTAMMRCTSLPTAIVACFIGSGQVKGGGAAAPEHIVPREEYLRSLATQGLEIRSRWMEGFQDVHMAPGA